MPPNKHRLDDITCTRPTDYLAPNLYHLYCPQPYMYGLDDPKRTRLTASVFNGRKICGVFTPGGWLGGGQQQQQQLQQPVHGTILLPFFF